jgi:hypothetical protein
VWPPAPDVEALEVVPTYPDLKIRTVKTERVTPRRSFGITFFPIFVFFNISHYLSEAVCPC